MQAATAVGKGVEGFATAPADPVAATFKNDLSNLQDTYRMNSPATLGAAADALAAARRVYVAGSCDTSMASVLAAHLDAMLRNTLALPVGATSWDGYIRGMDARDVMVGVAYGPQHGPASSAPAPGSGGSDLREQLEWVYDQFGAAWHERSPRDS